MPQKVLLIGGSLNQTSILHQVAQHLTDVETWYTPFYAEGLMGTLADMGLLGFSILGGRHRRNTENYLQKHHLAVDYGAKARDYDAVITCTDLMIQRNLSGKRLILIQEGMTDPENWIYHAVKTLKLPRYLANTAASGLSNAYDAFCVASSGYRDLFVRKGVRADKLVVTGIPNFDHVEQYYDNNFPYQHYVLATTTNARETFKPDDRRSFILQARRIAGHRRLIFKLHPNENFDRARREIGYYAPDALVLTGGNTNHMIANCDALVSQYSSVLLVALAMGKEIHTPFDITPLRRLTPLQNGGTSAQRIADVCHNLLKDPAVQPRTFLPQSVDWKSAFTPLKKNKVESR